MCGYGDVCTRVTVSSGPWTRPRPGPPGSGAPRSPATDHDTRTCRDVDACTSTCAGMRTCSPRRSAPGPVRARRAARAGVGAQDRHHRGSRDLPGPRRQLDRSEVKALLDRLGDLPAGADQAMVRAVASWWNAGADHSVDGWAQVGVRVTDPDA